MTGIYTRKIYDECYDYDNVYSLTYEGNYKTNPIQHNMPLCGPNNTSIVGRDYWFNPRNGVNPGNFADLESHLKNIDSYEYCDNTDPREIRKKSIYLTNKVKTDKISCNDKLDTGFERLTESKLDFKGSTYNGFGFPLETNETSVFFGFGEDTFGDNRFGVSSRIISKDTKPADQYKNLRKLK